MLQSNSFMGQFHLPPYPNMNLSWIDVSDNHFDGQLQKSTGTILPRLWLLHLSGNAFQGPLPSSIANEWLGEIGCVLRFFLGSQRNFFLIASTWVFWTYLTMTFMVSYFQSTPTTFEFEQQPVHRNYIMLDNHDYLSHTKHTEQKINRSTLFTFDNMHYLNFRI